MMYYQKYVKILNSNVLKIPIMQNGIYGGLIGMYYHKL